MTLAARLTARAALCAAPSTPVSATEVSWVLGIGIHEVRAARPASAVRQPGRRAITAPWADWLEAIDGAREEEPRPGGLAGPDRHADAREGRARRQAVLADQDDGHPADRGLGLVVAGRGRDGDHGRPVATEDTPLRPRGRAHRG